MTNQFGNFLLNLVQLTKLLRNFLNGHSMWPGGKWQCTTNSIQYTIKGLLASPLVLAQYSVNYPTVVTTGASAYGLGALLI